MRRKFLYHVSSTWHGDRFQPILRTPDNMSKKEPPVPRFCVCPTIAGCFAARLMLSHKTAFIYKTSKPVRSITPYRVWDSILTGERWLIPPVTLIHVANINAMHVDRIQRAVIHFHHKTKRSSDLLTRLAQYCRAFEILGGPAWERRLIERWKVKFNIGDPETYLRLAASNDPLEVASTIPLSSGCG